MKPSNVAYKQASLVPRENEVREHKIFVGKQVIRFVCLFVCFLVVVFFLFDCLFVVVFVFCISLFLPIIYRLTIQHLL